MSLVGEFPGGDFITSSYLMTTDVFFAPTMAIKCTPTEGLRIVKYNELWLTRTSHSSWSLHGPEPNPELTYSELCLSDATGATVFMESLHGQFRCMLWGRVFAHNLAYEGRCGNIVHGIVHRQLPTVYSFCFKNGQRMLVLVKSDEIGKHRGWGRNSPPAASHSQVVFPGVAVKPRNAVFCGSQVQFQTQILD